MEYKVQLTYPARKDIKSIVDYIKEDDIIIGDKIQEKLMTSTTSLETLPNRGTNLSTRISVIVDYKFIICENYMIVYMVKENSVIVYRVFDMRRDYQSLL